MIKAEIDHGSVGRNRKSGALVAEIASWRTMGPLHSAIRIQHGETGIGLGHE